MELLSKTQLGGQKGDTCRGDYLNKVYADGVYGWLRGCVFEFQFGGQFLFDPDETNGWSQLGAIDNTNSARLANATSEVWSYLAGGPDYDYDVEILRLAVKGRENNAGILPWGWCLAHQKKNPGTNTVDSTNMVLHEVNENGGVGPRDYPTTFINEDVIELANRPNAIVPAGNNICLAVSSPTADPTNRYMQLASGRIVMRRL